MQRQRWDAQPGDGTCVPEIATTRNDPGFLLKSEFFNNVFGAFAMIRHENILLQEGHLIRGEWNWRSDHSGQEQDCQDGDEHANQQQNVEIERGGLIDGAQVTGDIVFGLRFEIHLADDHVQLLVKLGQAR